ncbi:hypothetical protein [Bordetella genomosp. 9]|uniref:hypothetical protein n=1 Tax=Bordetella genomosp. 9 TaxID=1416803 RepID=UPI0018E0106F|nr:hypothetical protein [Bordetella genomosp. 9]
MASLVIERAAEEDLDLMWESGDPIAERAVASIEILLEEIGCDVDFLSRMHSPNVRWLGEPSADTDRIVKLWRDGYNILRLKAWDQGALIPYRILYAYDPRYDCFHVLGIVHREHCYEIDHPRVKRIIADYHSLGIPTY